MKGKKFVFFAVFVALVLGFFWGIGVLRLTNYINPQVSYKTSYFRGGPWEIEIVVDEIPKTNLPLVKKWIFDSVSTSFSPVYGWSEEQLSILQDFMQKYSPIPGLEYKVKLFAVRDAFDFYFNDTSVSFVAICSKPWMLNEVEEKIFALALHYGHLKQYREAGVNLAECVVEKSKSIGCKVQNLDVLVADERHFYPQ